jgi:hypothetical protein
MDVKVFLKDSEAQRSRLSKMIHAIQIFILLPLVQVDVIAKAIYLVSEHLHKLLFAS